MYVHSDKVGSTMGCFSDRNTSNMLNIHIRPNTISLNTFLKTSYYESLTFSSITWTYDDAKGLYYNTTTNIYI